MQAPCCRPLPEELLEYAQTDVHYLCYLAGQLGTQLGARGPGCLQEASRRSHEMCLALYSKPSSEVSPACPLSVVSRCASRATLITHHWHAVLIDLRFALQRGTQVSKVGDSAAHPMQAKLQNLLNKLRLFWHAPKRVVLHAGSSECCDSSCPSESKCAGRWSADAEGCRRLSCGGLHACPLPLAR